MSGFLEGVDRGDRKKSQKKVKLEYTQRIYISVTISLKYHELMKLTGMKNISIHLELCSCLIFTLIRLFRCITSDSSASKFQFREDFLYMSLFSENDSLLLQEKADTAARLNQTAKR